MAQYDLNLRDYTRILRKRMFLVIFSAVMLGAFSFFFAMTKKPIPLYKSTSSVKIEEAVSMTGLYMESITYSDADPMITQSAIITSIPVMELVTKEAGLIDKDIPSEEVMRTSELLNKVLSTKSKISTSIEDETSIINISAVTRDPALSAKLANITAKVFKQVNTLEKNKRTIEAKKFIENRLNIVGKRLRATQEKLKTLRLEKKFVTMDSLTRETVLRLREAEIEHKKVVSSIKKVDELIDHLQTQKDMPGDEGEANDYADTISPIFNTLNSKLEGLNSKRSILLLDLTEIHPHVVRIDKEIENTKENMLKQLYAQRKEFEEIIVHTTEIMKKQEAEYRTLPGISFELAEIEINIDTDAILFQQLQSKYQEVLIREAEKIEEVTIVRPALESHTPTNPATTGTTTVIGIIIGFILGVVVAFVRETIDTSIGTIEEVEGFLGVPVVGIIPFMDVDEIKDKLLRASNTDQPEEILELNARLVSHFAPKSTMAESYRAMRTGIEFILADKKLKSLSITSSSMGEGKTTVTCNFAMSLAQIGKKVLLIDGDLRKPMVNRVYGIEREPGLADIILGNYDWAETIKTDTDIMMGEMGMEDITTAAPGINNLNIITAGLIPPNSAELLNSAKMKEILSEMIEAYDIVLCDSPPVLPSTDAVILAQQVEGVIMVYKVGQVARGSLKRAKSQIDNTKANVIGVVLNCLKPESGGDYKDYGYYGYYYSYGEEAEIRPWYKRLFPSFTMPEIVNRLIETIRGEKEEGDDEEGKSYLREEDTSILPWYKRWLRTIILIVALAFILCGLLWQFGVIGKFM